MESSPIPLVLLAQRKGLRQSYFVRHANVTRSTVSAWFNGKAKPVRCLEEMIDLTGLTADDLLRFDQPDYKPGPLAAWLLGVSPENPWMGRRGRAPRRPIRRSRRRCAPAASM